MLHNARLLLLPTPPLLLNPNADVLLPDIMCLGINAQGLQAAQVQLLGISRVRFQDDLELSVTLHTVGVVTIAAVIRADGGLSIAHIPGLRT